MSQSSGYSFSIQVDDCNKNINLSPDGQQEIIAAFTSDKTYGSAPLTVHFTDRSQGGAMRWQWNFGDGGIDTIQHPEHTYLHEGIYTVKLSVWDADSVADAEAKNNYIRAVGYGGCDSLNYDIPGSYYLYQVVEPETGYLSGNNSRGDLAKSSYFNVEEGNGELMGGLFYFAKKAANFATDPPIVFKVWDNDGPGNTPGTVLDSTTIPLSQILIDEFGTGVYPATVPFFDEWVSVDGGFYLGVELPQTVDDTVAIFTNKTSAAIIGNGWEQTSTGEWRTYDEGNPGFDVDNAIFPIICQPTGIDNPIIGQRMVVYPIPANDNLYVTFFDQGLKNVKISIVDLSGRVVVSPGSNIASGAAINVSHLREGLYILRLYTKDGIINKKIVIE